MSATHSYTNQRGDAEISMSILVIIICVFLFAGEPDAWDKLHAYVMSLQPVGTCQPHSSATGSAL